MKDSVSEIPEIKGRLHSGPSTRTETLSYFILTVLGFSFWFLMAVPFASHRETYGWLAGVPTENLAQQFSLGQSSTYRPLAQVVTWLGFLILEPRVFPTSVLRQALLQGFVYGMFVLAWWIIYSAVPNRRLFALVAFIAGGTFFSGYVQLFHIYGMFYVPVVLTLGVLLRFASLRTFEKRQIGFAIIAIVLAFWHPFATALFMGFFLGYYLDTFRQCSRGQHIQALAILLVGAVVIGALVVIFPRAHMPLDAKLLGFLVSYQTNEVNRVSSFVAILLTQMVVFSTRLPSRLKAVTSAFAFALSIVFLLKGLPILFIWFSVVLIKLITLRRWSLFFLMLTAALLPLGGGIGTPVYVLFAIIVAVYTTSLEWVHGEKALSFVETRYVIGAIAVLAILLLMVRGGIRVPILTKIATPLLAERERTYQFEDLLARLHNSDYCGYQITFAENAGSPVEDVESAINRQHRPPAALPDVQLFWDTVLRCKTSQRLSTESGTAVVTFGGAALADSTPVLNVTGKYAGDATVWVEDSRK
jgi:hypothetical protein